MDRLEFFAAAVAADPDQPRARFGYAVELDRAGRLDEAVAQYRHYLGQADDEGNAWQRLGVALAALGRPDEAADAFLAGIDAAASHGHHGMAEDLRDLLEAL